MTVYAMLQAAAPVLSVSDVAITFAGLSFLYFAKRFSDTADLVRGHHQTLHGGANEKGVLTNIERLFEFRRADADVLTEIKLKLDMLHEDVKEIERRMDSHNLPSS